MFETKPSRVADAMSATVITIGADTLVSNILSQMSELRFRHMPVVDADRKLLGLLTQRDLLHASTSSLVENEEGVDLAVAGVRANQLMKSAVLTVKPHDTLAEAATLMLQNKVGCAPVVDDDNVLVGIITDTDFIRVATYLLSQ